MHLTSYCNRQAVHTVFMGMGVIIFSSDIYREKGVTIFHGIDMAIESGLMEILLRSS